MDKITKLFIGFYMMVVSVAHPVNKEIEIKFQVSDEKLAELKNWLYKNAKHKGDEQQTEYYLDNPNHTWYFKSKDGYIDALNALRVRMTDKGDSVCHKYSNIDFTTSKVLSKYEYESKVSDGKTMIELFERLGYTDKILVQKKRQKYDYKDVEIVIDVVDNLGTFVEVELKRVCADEQEARQYLYDFLKSIGITTFMQYYRSYIHMFKNPGFDFSDKVELV